MSKSEYSMLSGWAFVAGAFAFLSILSNSDTVQIPGSVLSSILLTIAMSGLRVAYGERIGSLGRSMLLLGMLGPVVCFIVIASMGVMNSFGKLTETHVREGLWVLLFVGPAISLLGLTLFGLTALRSQPMPRLNWLPILVGIWYPVTYTIFSIYDISQKGVFPEQAWPLIVLTVVLQFITLCSLGFTLLENSSKELATT